MAARCGIATQGVQAPMPVGARAGTGVGAAARDPLVPDASAVPTCS